MIIYLDETYDYRGVYFILGALFVLQDHDIFLDSFNSLKREENFSRPDGTLRELKYVKIKHGKYEKAAVKAIQAFKAHNCYFRAVIVPLAQFDLRYFGKSYELEKIKRARAYKKFAEMLIEYNTPEVSQGVLFADNLTRCKGALGCGDEFVEVMRERFQNVIYDHDLDATPANLKHVQEVPSDDDRYALLQVCDVLLGSTLNGILKTFKGPRMVHKNRVTEKMKEILELPSLEKDYWQPLTKLYAREYKTRIAMADYKRATTSIGYGFGSPNEKGPEIRFHRSESALESAPEISTIFGASSIGR
ncbi:MAG: DUF3800 domain-containing protein [Candidatus Acidiferrales bacterium]